VAAHHLGGEEALVASVKQDVEPASVPEKLKALLAIAAKVQLSGNDVTDADIAPCPPSQREGSRNTCPGSDRGLVRDV